MVGNAHPTPLEGTPGVTYLLNLAYLLTLVAASPWLFWAALRKGKYREGYAAKFLGRVPERSGRKPCLWLHAVSVGEVNLLAPLVDRISRRRPDWECVISTTTMAGMKVEPAKFTQEKKVPAEIVARLQGRYQLAPAFILTVRADGEKLFVKATNQPEFRVYAESETEWKYRVVDARLSSMGALSGYPGSSVRAKALWSCL